MYRPCTEVEKAYTEWLEHVWTPTEKQLKDEIRSRWVDRQPLEVILRALHRNPNYRIRDDADCVDLLRAFWNFGRDGEILLDFERVPGFGSTLRLDVLFHAVRDSSMLLALMKFNDVAMWCMVREPAYSVAAKFIYGDHAIDPGILPHLTPLPRDRQTARLFEKLRTSCRFPIYV
jgi:hypothetical protein